MQSWSAIAAYGRECRVGSVQLGVTVHIRAGGRAGVMITCIRFVQVCLPAMMGSRGWPIPTQDASQTQCNRATHLFVWAAHDAQVCLPRDGRPWLAGLWMRVSVAVVAVNVALRKVRHLRQQWEHAGSFRGGSTAG